MGQNDFAEKCKINPGNFSKAVNGHIPFSERALMRIAAVGEVSYDQLVNGDLSQLPLVKRQNAKSGTEAEPMDEDRNAIEHDAANELAGLKKRMKC